MNRIQVVVVALALTACGPSWKIVKQAPADQLVGKNAFVTAPSDFSQVKVNGKSEEEFIASSKDPATVRERWAGVKNGIQEEMFKAVSERAKELTLSNSGSGLTLKPIVTLMETGCPTGFCHSTLHVTLQITSADGAVLDEVQFESSHGNNVFEATDERRMRADGENVGKAMAKYLKSRVAGQ